MRPVTALIVALAIALPWYIAVAMMTDGEWLRGFFLIHNLERALSPMEGHDGSVLFYPVALLAGSFPWSVFAVPLGIDLVRRLRRGDRAGDGLVFACCWVGVYIGLFSIARTKLPSYITPCYPAVAMLVGAFVDRWLRRSLLVSSFWQYMAFTTFVLVGVVLGIALPIAASQFLPGEQWLGLIVGGIPVIGGAGAITFLFREQRWASAASFATAAVLFSLSLFTLSAARVGRYQPSARLVQLEADVDDAQFAAIGGLEPSWVFYAKRPILQLHGNDGAVDFLSSGESRYLITNDATYGAIKDELPTSSHIVRRMPRFLKPGELLLIGNEHPRTAAGAGDIHR